MDVLYWNTRKNKKLPGTNCHFDLIISNQERLFIWPTSNYFLHPSGIICSFSPILNYLANRADAGLSLIREQWHVILFLPLCSFIHLSGVFKRSRVTLVTSSCWESILEYFSCNWQSSTSPWILFWNISNYLLGWLAIHQDTYPHCPANVLFWIFMKCIHGYLGCSPPPVLECFIIWEWF